MAASSRTAVRPAVTGWSAGLLDLGEFSDSQKAAWRKIEVIGRREVPGLGRWALFAEDWGVSQLNFEVVKWLVNPRPALAWSCGAPRQD